MNYSHISAFRALSFVGPLIFSLSACQARTPVESPSRPSLMMEAFEKAQRMQVTQEAFQRDHPYRGVNSLSYIKQLQSEGFGCRLQYRQRVFNDTDQLGRLKTRQEPAVECFREPSRMPECAVFRVGLRLAWHDPTATLPRLVKQLAGSEITDSVFVCETTPISAEDRAAVSAAMAQGYAVLID